MVRDELASEISMRRDIPMETVEEVLDEQALILCEEEKRRKKKKCICVWSMIIVFLAGMAAAVVFLDKKEKICLSDIEDMIKKNIKKYTDKLQNRS